MGSFERNLYNSVIEDDNITAKAIANFLFREIIEDAHVKYNISQEDIREMCKEAVNRAAVLERVLGDEELKKALLLYGYSTQMWDAPDAGSVEEKLKEFADLAEHISES